MAREELSSGPGFGVGHSAFSEYLSLSGAPTPRPEFAPIASPSHGCGGFFLVIEENWCPFLFHRESAVAVLLESIDIPDMLTESDSSSDITKAPTPS